ncbi:unnamed protein product, partial [marine sediment metagenome]
MAADETIVPDVGLEITTDRLLTAPNGGEPKWVEWGTGSTSPAAGDTDLTTPSAEARSVGTQTQETNSTADDT